MRVVLSRRLFIGGGISTGLLPACSMRTPEVSYNQRGSSAISYAEIQKRAKSRPTVSYTLGQLGTQVSRPHENMLTLSTGERYSCRDKTIVTPEGVLDIAVCLAVWHWELPSSTLVTFVYQHDITKRTPLSRAMYLEIDHLRHWHY